MAGGMKRRYREDERGRELPKKRPLPWSETPRQKDDTARESQRRANAYGRARGRL